MISLINDQPIESKKDDQLDRKLFAEHLCKAILGYKDKNSLTIALDGVWGSGKSSIVKMMLDSISDSGNRTNKPIIIKFNPWYFSNQNDLINQFFKSLLTSLNPHTHQIPRALNDLGKQISAYSKALSPLSNIATGLLSFQSTCLINQTPIEKVINLIPDAAQNVGEALEDVSNLYLDKDLHQLKEEINNKLENQTKKLLIVMDDIDRLTKQEVIQVFQLVKCLADFKNTIYILAYDKKIINQHLQDSYLQFSDEYLDKIIQVSIKVPTVSNDKLKELLFNELENIITGISKERRWNIAYEGVLKTLFSNLRHVKRYINLIHFSYPLVEHEVNKVDFCILTVIQLFIPELFQKIHDNKYYFLDDFIGDYYILQNRQSLFQVSDEQIQGERSKFKEMFSCSTNKLSYTEILEILKILFPVISRIFPEDNFNIGKDMGRETRSEQIARNRIFFAECFDTYFSLFIPSNSLTYKEMKFLFDSSLNQIKFEKFLETLEENKLYMFLQVLPHLLKDNKEYFEKSKVQSILHSLCNMGDLLFENYPYSFPPRDTPERIRDIIIQVLEHNIESTYERFEILKFIFFNSSNNIFTLGLIADWLNCEMKNFDSHSSSNEQPFLGDRKQFNDLIEIFVLKLNNFYKSKGNFLTDIGSSQRFWFILFRWLELSNHEGAAKECFHRVLSSDDSFLKFLEQFLNKSLINGQKLNLESIQKFATLEEVIERLEIMLKNHQLPSLQREKAQRYLMEIKREIDVP